MSANEREAERRLSGIMREFAMDADRPGGHRSHRVVCLAYSPVMNAHGIYSEMIVVSKPLYDGVKALVEARVIPDNDAYVLRQRTSKGASIDVFADVADGRILFRIGAIRDAREANA